MMHPRPAVALPVPGPPCRSIHEAGYPASAILDDSRWVFDRIVSIHEVGVTPPRHDNPARLKQQPN